jgi:divalent metal cation (Fe/Co/Zn/Cd) transporter
LLALVSSSKLKLLDLDRNTQLSLAASAATVSIAAKEALYHATVRIGERIKSKVLIANAWHHRTDAISSVVALGAFLTLSKIECE